MGNVRMRRDGKCEDAEVGKCEVIKGMGNCKDAKGGKM